MRTSGARRRETVRKARKTVLWALATFIALQAALTYAMESWWCVLRDPGYGFKLATLKMRLHEEQAPLLVLMVGSSHVADGLRGQVIEDDLARQVGRPVIVYNFGNPADGPLAQLLNVQRLLAEGIRPDLLLVEVMPVYLSESANYHLTDVPAERFGLRDRIVLHQDGMPVRRLSRYSEMNWLLPCYAHRFEILSVLLPRFLPANLRQDHARKCDASGWVEPAWYAASLASQATARKAALEGHGAMLMDFKLGNRFVPAFDRLLSLCQEEQIPAALVLMPEEGPLRAVYPREALEQVEAFCADLTARYGAPVINARDWVPDGGYFFDHHHLFPEGAALFTARLGREAVLPLLEGRYPPPPANAAASAGHRAQGAE